MESKKDANHSFLVLCTSFGESFFVSLDNIYVQVRECFSSYNMFNIVSYFNSSSIVVMSTCATRRMQHLKVDLFFLKC